MIQGGDPTGTGKGGTSIWGKKNDEIRESLKHNARGILSMANSGPNTNGSQFFISYAKQTHLNGLFTVFGRVIHGFEVLDLMEKVSSLMEASFTSDRVEIMKACFGGSGPYHVDEKFCGGPGTTVFSDLSKLINWDGNQLTEAAYKLIAKGLVEGPFANPSLKPD
ncbi:GDSL esterase/lipase [Trifolium repens]|nr:GDSL esterase/lipase [Trifolium repens]